MGHASDRKEVWRDGGQRQLGWPSQKPSCVRAVADHSHSPVHNLCGMRALCTPALPSTHPPPKTCCSQAGALGDPVIAGQRPLAHNSQPLKSPVPKPPIYLNKTHFLFLFLQPHPHPRILTGEFLWPPSLGDAYSAGQNPLSPLSNSLSPVPIPLLHIIRCVSTAPLTWWTNCNAPGTWHLQTGTQTGQGVWEVWTECVRCESVKGDFSASGIHKPPVSQDRLHSTACCPTSHSPPPLLHT